MRNLALPNVVKRLVSKGILRRLGAFVFRRGGWVVDDVVSTERFGTEFGAWEVVTAEVGSSSIVYSFGVGNDVSFDVALIERFGLTVHAFDPTPQCVKWVHEQGLPSDFVMHEVGIADFDGNVTFNPPENPGHVSYTILDRPSTAARAIAVPVRRLSTIMRELGHTNIDLLKMDVEGAEYSVITDIAACGVRPGQILVEFHHRFEGVGVKMTEDAIRTMRGMGYRLVHVSDSGEEFSFVFGRSKHEATP